MRRIFEWVALGLLVSLAGCGGGGEKSNATPASAAVPAPAQGTPANSDSPAQAADNPAPADPVPASAPVTTPPAADPVAAVNNLPPADPTTPTDPSQPVEPATPAVEPEPVELTAEEIRAKTLGQMVAIGKALEAYLAEHGHYPPPAIYNAEGAPLLSWRVLLLPQLGHQELFDKFKQDQAWDGPENSLLVKEIPPVLQSHGVEPGKTNFLVPQGSGTVFDKPEGTTLDAITDGPLNTAILLEVDNDRAVTWTEPRDYRPTPANARMGLGRRHRDGFLALFGGLTLARLKTDVPGFQIGAIYSIAGGEPYKRTAIGVDLNGEVGLPLAADALPVVPETGGEEKPGATGASGVAEKLRAPIPSAEEQRVAMDLLRETYKKEYDDAKSREDKQKLGVKLIDQARKIRAATPERFVLLKVGMDVAAKNGEATAALVAVDEMAHSFEIARLPIAVDTIIKLDGSVREPGENTRLFKESATLIEQVVTEDQFAQAGEVFNVAISAARRSGDRVAAGQVEDLRKRVFDMKSAYADIEPDLAKLATTPDDPAANLNVGRYYILIKGDWLKGLPMLAASGDETLRQLAADDIAVPATPEEQIKLADRWWEQGVRPRGAQYNWPEVRAAQWYREAVKVLDSGLLKVQADRRIKEVEKELDPAKIPEMVRVPKEEKAE